ncbi:MAG: 50S ribosomal protein L18 [Armatimonadetes bacterium]|jgi:large subunit ribosomal protein L18|nr:50S ribosomal protein L18 [Armatimonadota bacterium]
MAKTNPRMQQLGRRHIRVRRKVHGEASCPRLCVHKSLKYIYAQVIDDRAGHTLATASSREPDLRDERSSGMSVDAAKAVGAALAARAKEKGIERVVFDRGGYLYHGRVKALADAAREGGLEF